MSLSGRVLAWLVVGIMLAPPPAMAQAAAQGAAQAPAAQAPGAEGEDKFKPEELEQIVAPIALHPDALLAQVLMASTYPLEVVEAARFMKANANLQGDQLNEALKQFTWDDSVKSMTSFPQVLSMMSEKLDWLQKLGDAFLGQQQELLAAIQRLRARAQNEGYLKSGPEQTVTVEPAASPPTGASGSTTVVQQPAQIIKIESPNPEVVYVPSYNPQVVYGAFPPAYPPYYPYPPGYFAAGAFTFAAGMAVGAAVWGNCNWGGGDVNINNSKSANFSRNVNNRQTAENRINQRNSAGGGQGGRSNFQHNPEHRKGVQYRDQASQQKFNKGGPGNAQAREQFRGRQQQGGGLGGQQGGLGQGQRGGGAGQQGGFGQGQRGGGAGAGQAGGGLGDRGGQAGGQRGGGGGLSQGGGSGVSRAGAFDGAGGGGRDAQSFSNRGNASRDSFNRSSGGASRAGSGGFSGGGGGGGGARAGGGGGGGGSRGGGGGGGGGGRGGGGGGRR